MTGHLEFCGCICKGCTVTPRSKGIFRDYDEGAEDAVQFPRYFAGGLGVVVTMCEANESQKMASFMLIQGVKTAVLTAYTYDLLELNKSLIHASQRGLEVTVIGDRGHLEAGATTEHAKRFKELQMNGVKIVLTAGKTASSGIQHSKTLLVDRHFLHGSTNWSGSSRKNSEWDSVTRLNEVGLKWVSDWHQKLLGKGRAMTIAEADKGQEVRDTRRTRSVGPNQTFQEINRKFSIANSRRKNSRDRKNSSED